MTSRQIIIWSVGLSKTESNRLSKTDVESAGLDAEGMATSVSKLRDEIQSLSGVDIMLNEDGVKCPR